MIQTQNSATWPISRFDSIMSELINENEESLFCQHLTNSYLPDSTTLTQESCDFGNQDSILVHPFELAQNFEKHLDILASYPFPEVEVENDGDPEPHIGDSISLLDSIVTLISLPNFFHIS